MNKKKRFFGSTVGVGYISMMLIFTVICLTILAVLSFQAVYSNDRVSRRSERFTQEYYDADMAAKRTLAQLDGIALECAESFSFEESFISGAEELSGITTARVPGGVRADYSARINDRQRLYVSVVFYGDPAAGRYEVLQWRTVTEDNSSDSTPAVWDGSDLV